MLSWSAKKSLTDLYNSIPDQNSDSRSHTLPLTLRPSPREAELRNFRDSALRSNVPGELFVESYYTFAPAVSKLIAPSDLLRRVVRAGLGPLLDLVKAR